ncbi:nucleotide pyrophosphohydrolase [Candidatus Kaiserbacteria bacterium]|nr:nucleotide pyrophosphohydrolase [Candidatus Kaiserbacteria bacterium]
MKQMEQDILEHLTERSWHRLRPGDIAKSISIESAELLEVFQWDNPTLDEVKADEKRTEALRKELADVLIYCFEMAALLEIDVEEAMRAKLEKVKQKYPAKLFKDLDPDHQGTHDIYWQIKREHRQKGE